MRLFLTCASLFSLLFPVMPQAGAEQLNPKSIPKNAKWVCHLDHDALSDTELMKRIRDRQQDLIEKTRGWLQEEYGIDPRQDLHGLTLYGESFESNAGTAILFADFDADKVKADLASKPGVEKSEWQGHTVYCWDVKQAMLAAYSNNAPSDKQGQSQRSRAAESQQREARAPAEPQRPESAVLATSDLPSNPPFYSKKRDDKSSKLMSMILVDEKSMVIASDREQAQAAVKLLKGEADSLQGTDSKLIAEVPDKAFFYGAAIDLEGLKQHDGMFPILRQHKQVTWAIGEDNGKLFEQVHFVAQNDQVAEKMKQGIEGLNALVQLWCNDAEATSELYSNVQVEQDGTTVRVNWEGEVSKVLAAVDEVKQRMQSSQQARK